jgi:hypothetical protein
MSVLEICVTVPACASRDAHRSDLCARVSLLSLALPHPHIPSRSRSLSSSPSPSLPLSLSLSSSPPLALPLSRIKWCGVGASTGPTQAGVCCGVGKPSDLNDWGGAMYTDVSTKACQFGSDPVYLTSLSGKQVSPVQCWVKMPTGCGRPLSETNTPLEWFVDGATNEASCKARKAAYDNHCMKKDAQLEFKSMGGISNNWDVIGRKSLKAALGWCTCCSGVRALTF